MSIGTTLVRGTVGTLFMGHGAQKLFGWFEGHGPEGTGGFFESLGLRPGRRHAISAGLAETLGGAMLAAGALTPVAAAMLNGTMATAMRTAHKGKGPWVSSGGWEYNLVLMAIVTALADSGPGRPSVDAARFPWMKGPLFAAAALGAGVAGSYLITSERLQAPETPQPEQDATREGGGRFTRGEETAVPEQTGGTPASTTLPG